LRYKVDFTSQAFQNISELDKPIAERILNKIDWLADNLDIILPQPLRGEFQGVYKLVVGDWRVLYSIDYPERIITIHIIGHRSNVYRKKK